MLRAGLSRVGLVVLCAAAALALGAPAASARPLGAALWFACTQAEPLSGPPALACPRPYDERYARTAVQGFDRFTPENEMKMVYVQPEAGRFDFALVDRILAFAREHGKTVRGHTLISHTQLPGWVAKPMLQWERRDLIEALRRHVHEVVRHVRETAPGVVTTWDVVNEPLADDGTLRRSVWSQVIGPDFLRIALHAARDVDPTGRLVINEYDVDLPGPKSDALVQLAADLRRQGAPLDGVGIQGHITTRSARSQEWLEAYFARFARLDVEVEITELDVTGGTPTERAHVFERYARACRNASNCKGMTVWGVADPYSWQGDHAGALLFDNHFQPKPALGMVRSALSAPAATPRKKVRRAKQARRGCSAKASRKRCGRRR